MLRMSAARLSALSRTLPPAHRAFSQAAQPARQATSPLPSAEAALRRTKLVHRQSSKWRAAAPSATDAAAMGNATPHAEAHAPPSESRTHRLLLSYHDLERALERRGFNTVRVMLAGAAALAAAVGLAWPRIKQWGAVEGAEVAAASLETEQLQEKASAMVHEVLADPKTAVQVETLLKKAVLGLFKDKEFTDQAVAWTSEVLTEALTWDSVVQQGSQYVTSVFDDAESKRSAQQYLSHAIQNVVADETVQDTVAKSLWSSVRASLLGRRRPRDNSSQETPKAQPSREMESLNKTNPPKEAIYASSSIDDATEGASSIPVTDEPATDHLESRNVKDTGHSSPGQPVPVEPAS